MNYPVVKGAGYALIQASGMLVHYGTTQTTEGRVNPESEHLQKLPGHLRSFEAAVKYPPNQTYIGNITPDGLSNIPRPWYENPINDADRNGKYGEIMPEDEFIGLMKIVDIFDLVVLEEKFQASVKEKLAAHPILAGINKFENMDKNISAIDEIKKMTDEHLALPLYFENLMSFIAFRILQCLLRR